MLAKLTGNKESEIKYVFESLIELYDSLESIKGTVCLNNDYKPWEVDRLELQHEDYRGLFFWYNETLKEIASNNKQTLKISGT